MRKVCPANIYAENVRIRPVDVVEWRNERSACLNVIAGIKKVEEADPVRPVKIEPLH